MNKKIRVAFFPPSDFSWMGGVNYYRNLFYALKNYSSNEVHLVAFFSVSSDKNTVSEYSGLIDEIHYVSFLDKNSVSGLLSKVENYFLGRFSIIEFFLKKYNIDIVSHSSFCGFDHIKSIGWIPDFQHLHLPEMFSKKEFNERNKKFLNLINKSDAVFLSSSDALKSFESFFPGNKDKARVLRFVSQPEPLYFLLNGEDKASLIETYKLPEKFYYLPNQFWKHKNHMLAFDAIKILKGSGYEYCLVCSGDLNDYRSPEYIKTLQNYIFLNGLENNIKLLGLVPYEDVFKLMKFSVAVINPSLFEGWSSTVEECKSIGKRLIVSDIDVHKEQAPNADFFNKNDPNSLADVIFSFESSSLSGSVYDLEERTKDYAFNFVKNIKQILNEC